MQYHCVQCNEVFTADPSEDKPRCPKCLRQHGLRPVEGAKPAAQKRSLLPVLAVAGALVAAGGGYAAYHKLHGHKPGQVPLAPISADELREDALALTGKDAGELVQLLAADARVKAFAERAARGQSGAAAQAQAVCSALEERRQKQAFLGGARVEARETPPLTASGALAAIEKDGARVALYPLEAAALAVAAVRSLGTPALVAEVFRYPDEHKPLDPSGRLGYYALALPRTEGAPEQLFDAYAGRKTAPAAGDYKLLNDAQALGAALSLRGLTQLDNGRDTRAGLADSELAVKLSPSSAAVRSVRAALLLATGGVEAGTHELDAAFSLRSDAPRRNNLATLGLLSDNPDAAAKEIAAALAEAPDYALAHVTLATVHLMRGEQDLGRAELEKAERLEPDLAMLPQIWAQYYASANDMDQALAKAQEGVRRRPNDTQALLVLARIDRAAGRYDDMRKQARAIMAHVPSDQHERMQELLRGMLGPTVFEDAAGGDDAPEAGGGVSLSGEAKPGNGPHLLSDSDAPKTGALQLQPGGPKLKLGGDDSRLQLKLNP